MPPIVKTTQPPRGPGGRIRVTNRSRLRIFQGSIEADNVILEEEGSARGLSTAGVDAEDAKEHHLQVVLSLQTLDDKNSAVEKKAHIPIPDATGITSNYEELYAGEKWEDSKQYLRFSDIIDESLDAGLRDGYTYDIDEEDREWLDRNEAAIRSQGATANGPRSSRTKSKSKDQDGAVSIPFHISDSDFELVMGLLEMVCDTLRPTLHADLSTIPSLSDFEQTFAEELEEDFFAMFEVPPTVPKPEQLWLTTKAIYPHWKERRLVRGGYRVMAELNTDETSEGDSFVCFRRRDPKPVRKTRRSDTSQIERFTHLRTDFEQAEDLARSTLLREQKKAEQLDADGKLYEARKRYATVRVQHPELGTTADDDKYLSIRDAGHSNKLYLHLPRNKSQSLEGPRPGDYMEQEDMTELVQARLEEEYRRRKLADDGFENQIDIYAQPSVKRVGMFKFQWTRHSIQMDPFTSRPPLSNTTSENRSYVGFRTRRGRGGIVRLDRALPHSARSATDSLFTRKPLFQPLPPRSLPNGDQMDVDGPEYRDEEAEPLPGIWDYRSPPEFLRGRFFRGDDQVDDPDMELNNNHVVDDFDVKYVLPRATLFVSDTKTNPLEIDTKYLALAHEYNKEARAKEMKAPLYAPYKSSGNVPVRISGQGQAQSTSVLGFEPGPARAAPPNHVSAPNAAMLRQVSEHARAQQQQAMASQHQQAVAHAMSQAAVPPNRPPPPNSVSPMPAHPPHPVSQLPSASPVVPPAPAASSLPKPANMNVLRPDVSPMQMHSSPPNGDTRHPSIGETPVRPPSAQHRYNGMQLPPNVPPTYARAPSVNHAAYAQYMAANPNYANNMHSMQQFYRPINGQLNGQKIAFAAGSPNPAPTMAAGSIHQLPQHYLPPGFTTNGVDAQTMNMALGTANLNLKLPASRKGPQRPLNGTEGMGQPNAQMPYVQVHPPPLDQGDASSPDYPNGFTAYTPHLPSPLPATPTTHPAAHPSKSPLQ